MTAFPRRHALTEAELRRLLRAAAATSGRDLSNAALGRRFGIGEKRVVDLLREHGVERPRAWRRPEKRSA